MRLNCMYFHSDKCTTKLGSFNSAFWRMYGNFRSFNRESVLEIYPTKCTAISQS